ncbi:oxysterol-binding protein 1-like [Limulus polyphemus]|uniref:Oxysterol-binding protein 1-like n=1 Tax=Limulus polyphemus TaxID=6850 RepID=A0ABM1BMF5_LIMPO|nr:oxysterol-binding protein 1-like [Limulus polyphemus]XP_022253154.1 oxysterol-binding protein 1-like [Limulus polyphemus]
MGEYKDGEMKGYLFKWTNYMKRYQKRWFVLSNGILSYYRSREEMGHTCRGTINLATARICTEDTLSLILTNNGTQNFHLKANSEVERQEWVMALELAKARAIRLSELEEEEANEFVQVPLPSEKNEFQKAIETLSAKLEDLSTCNEQLVRQGSALEKSLDEADFNQTNGGPDVPVKQLKERALLFKAACNIMIKTCTEYVQLAQNDYYRWQKILEHEHNRRVCLEETVEELAKDNSQLEEKAKKVTEAQSVDCVDMLSDEEEFYDAESDIILVASGKTLRRQSREKNPLHDQLDTDSGASSDLEENNFVKAQNSNSRRKNDSEKDMDKMVDETDYRKQGDVSSVGKRKRRIYIPEKPNYSINLWAIMKNCIGKELTKIPVPVNFNEPLSTLQRLTEEYEYSRLLDKASRCKDSCEQMAFVAAYTVSAYATTSNRSSKPFNPLLGETYECDRMDDLGWRCLSEQVSHHPPMLSQYCEGKSGWKCWQEFTMSSKFRGKYLQIIPLGIAHLEFPDTGHHYTWRKVTTYVHNIIFGRLWVDHQGEMDIINHTTGDKCHLKFVAYSYFSRDTPRKVTGVVYDKEGNHQWILQGMWDNKMEGAKVLKVNSSGNGKPVVETATYKLLWKRVMPLLEYEKMYNFTVLACQLNEPEEGVALTDSRLRPDQRLMEETKWDEANEVKLKLEEKQRANRRQLECEAQQAAAEGRAYTGYEPVWFKQQSDPITGNPVHIYQGRYWECKARQDWSMCPDIFSLPE